MASIKQITRDSRVATVDDERSIGNGVIVTLRQGFTWDQTCDNRVRGEDDVFAMRQALINEVYPFAGPYDK